MAARRASAGRSAQVKARRASSQVTPRSSHASARRATIATGTASSTSFAISAPSIDSGSAGDPGDAFEVRRRVPSQRVALAPCEVRTRLEDRITGRQRIALRERGEKIGGKPAAAAAQLDDLATPRRGEDGRHLGRERLAEQRCHLRAP